MKKLLKKILRPKRNKSGKKCYFLHLPKCGGTSLNKKLRATFDNPVHMDPAASKIAADAKSEPLGRFRESLQLYYMAQKRIDCLSGHFDWSNTAFNSFGNSWEYVTVLRDPVEKWFSHYFFNRYKKDEHFKIDLSIEEYLESESGRLIGRDYLYKLSESETIMDAKDNLSKFSVVGVLEDLSTFERGFETVFGVKLKLPITNPSPAGSEKQKAMTDPAIRAAVEELCRPNIEVYEHAKALA